MIGIQVTGATETAQRLTAASRTLTTQAERELNAAAVLLKSAVLKRMSDGGGRHPFFGRTGGRGDTLSARSGGSRRRILLGRARNIGGTLTASVGSHDRHIRFLEEGGSVMGKPYLRQPLAAAQTPQGVDRWKGTSIRDIPGAFLKRTLGGKLMAVRAIGRRLEFLYLLVRSINVRGRHVFERSRKEVEPQIASLYRGLVSRLVRSANG